MKIFLIGMPGSGKSTLGKEFAHRMAIRYLDLDSEIENTAGLSISEIFRQKGEKTFREKEAKVLRSLTQSYDSFVMSTGGGAPCFFEGIDFMNNSGTTIYLKITPTELVKRLEKERKHRPLLAQEEDLQQTVSKILNTRQSDYHKANIIVESDTISVQDLEKAYSRK